jgi:hypothetical protein
MRAASSSDCFDRLLNFGLSISLAPYTNDVRLRTNHLMPTETSCGQKQASRCEAFSHPVSDFPCSWDLLDCSLAKGREGAKSGTD